jgi:uncharacterized protein YbbC (DUF1343 family)
VEIMSTAAAVETGLERLFREGLKPYRGMRVGLLANPASVDRDFVHAAERFASSGEVRLAALFGPQHGFRADEQDNMIETADERHPRLGIPIHSLYGERRKPAPESLGGLDALFCDLFDVGARCYTFVWTMAQAMEACAECGVRFVVLDRPNPIGGSAVEGNVLDPRFRSFVGLYAVPMRHGMTAGELADYLNREFGIGAELDVIEARGWRREQWLDETGLPWVMPSPNMATRETATVYPGTVLLEGTNLSEGRGTVHPFEIVGAPFLDAGKLAERLNGARIEGARFRPAWFKPTFDKWQGQLCGGVQVHVADRKEYRPYAAGLEILAAARELAPRRFAWREPPFEYETEKMPVDILAGSDAIRNGIEEGKSVGEMERGWGAGLREFQERRGRYLRY